MAEDAIPERIWLQWTGYEYGSSWCSERIDDGDPEYVRADLVARAAPREPGDDLIRRADVLAAIREASVHYEAGHESWLVSPHRLSETIQTLAALRPDAGEAREEQGMLDRCPIDPDSRVGRFFRDLRVDGVDG